MSDGVWVCTSAFGRTAGSANGQIQAVEWIAASGAQGVEIREELLDERPGMLASLADALRRSGLSTVYSCARPLFSDNGQLDGDRFLAACERAVRLGIRRIKVGLGNLSLDGLDSALPALVALFEPLEVGVSIENDQTPGGGDPRHHQALHQALAERLPPSSRPHATLDLGNGCWTGHDLDDSARRLAPWLGYVHCKQGVWRDGQWHASAPDEATLAHWATLWVNWPANLARAIEFPVTPDALSTWVSTLSTLSSSGSAAPDTAAARCQERIS
ncbi:sugar phosphate isomerase/epimerase family protein [Larsenimonas suaedae]|uniref:Sugar phosphate isomerase/epimerase n=1 Tax=Larsenimonas suaedae TaxID=1851019 RepID=A0ABU1GVU7_9GAMM|nr:hypothetical protein [Larsenimonas suaedae]MCM2973240.1 hypothetical protein [Larsenimonas suaedae]MDR5896133.1 hypothetical protein [Larsenimonas suaedae]